MIEIINLEKSFGDSKILKGISSVLKLKTKSNHWTEWFGKTVLLKVSLGIQPRVRKICFGRIYSELEDDEKEN
jgi:phospholipid/cholesterol/gamma-HCH transport system ATP-binding protein